MGKFQKRENMSNITRNPNSFDFLINNPESIHWEEIYYRNIHDELFVRYNNNIINCYME